MGVDVASVLGKTLPAEHMPVVAFIQHECCKAAMDTAGGLSEIYLSAVILDIRIR